MRCSEFRGYTETDCLNKWNQQTSEDSDNDNSEDESDTDDEYQYESSDKNENNLNEKLLFEITTFLCNFLVDLLTKVIRHFEYSVKIKPIVL